MNFELYEEYKTKFWNLNMKVSMFAGVFALIVLVSINYFEAEIPHFIGLIMFGLFILSQIVDLNSFFSKYETIKGQKGELAIDELGIVWKGKKIDWKSIVDINIQSNEIDNKHKWDQSPKNNVSDGLNLIEIRTSKGQQLGGYYKLMNEYEVEKLKDLLKRCVFKNQLKYDIAKKIIQPKNYKEHQLLKQQIKENTDNKR